MRLTTSTPIKSIATIRSGSVGPFTRRTTASSSATLSVTSATCVTISSMRPPSTEHHFDPALETVLDFVHGRLGARHVHHVNVERPPIFGQIDGHAAWCYVDEHRQ